MGTRYNRLAEEVFTCTHNLCFGAKIRKNIKKSTEKKSFMFCLLRFKNNMNIIWTCFRNDVINSYFTLSQ